MLALPVIIVALLAVTAVGPSTTTAIIVIGLVFTPLIARTVRAAVLSERELEYVSAAKLRGERAPYIMFVEILPNVLQPVIVEFTVRLGYAIFTIATLSFLGLGIQPPSPDWGLQVSEEYTYLSAGDWWPTLFPALAIATLVIGDQPDRGCAGGGVRPVSATARAHALEVRDLDVAYRVRGVDRQVLRSLSFTVEAGRSYGLVGESGCGKSTAALAAVRYLPRNGKVTAGSVSVAGADMLAMSRRRSPPHPGGRRLDGLPGSRQGAQPVDPRGPPGGRGVRGRRRLQGRVAGAGAGDAGQGADRRPGQRDGALSRTSCRAACSSGS